MKDNIMFRLLMRSTLNVVLSAILAFITLTATIFLIAVASDYFPFVSNIAHSIRTVLSSDTVLFITYTLMLIGLFFVYFILLQWTLFKYFIKLNTTVKKIADGELHLNYQIPIRKSNPFGMLAFNVNQLSFRLAAALEEERKAEQAKNELVTNVSHDLRTPLTSVIGYLGLIEQDRYRDEIELRYYVQIAYEKSLRLHTLIDELFEYTRMRHDSVVLHKEQLNLVELLGQLLAQYHVTLQEEGMEGKMMSSSKSIMLEADPTMLARVFENLIANALHYGKEGKYLDIHVERRGEKAAVHVINYGEPISVMDLPHIFDRFYRVDRSRTHWKGGSGLGLAICKSIVEKHNGQIEVNSADEKTVFTIYLPITV
ncbi:sensor histidine kinase [Paenibacillus yanchengensis]|uniref:histidine kinase n=1 Tax=Paenibacillus yanchengensis TaxID=2035833 RepID=A0ABW4YL52_9BACL